MAYPERWGPIRINVSVWSELGTVCGLGMGSWSRACGFWLRLSLGIIDAKGTLF